MNDTFEQKWNSAFPTGKYRLEMALNTGIRLGQEDGTFITFEDHTFCWINAPDTQHCPVLIFCPADEKNVKPEFEIAMRLLSQVAFTTREPIYEFWTIGRYFGNGSLLQFHPRNLMGGLHADPKYIPAKSPSSRALILAYSFFKEGLNAKHSSVYYSFLSFYKVLQIGMCQGF